MKMAVSVEGLASAVKGRVVESGAPNYDEARALYNAMIDKRPAAIAYCADEADVAAALRYGVEHGLRIAVRGGGHNGGGLGSVDDGLVIDLSQMNAIEVDAEAKMARVGGGALLKDLLDATHEHGLTVPVGIIGTTGVGGLTLGGGMRHLTRGLGLTIDNLVAATVVLGRLHRPDRRRAGARALLGVARRGRQLRHRHVVLVPLSSPQYRAWRAGAVRHRRCLRGPGVVQGLPPCGARRGQRVLCLPVDSAGAAVSRGAAPTQGVRRRLDTGRRRGVR